MICEPVGQREVPLEDAVNAANNVRHDRCWRVIDSAFLAKLGIVFGQECLVEMYNGIVTESLGKVTKHGLLIGGLENSYEVVYKRGMRLIVKRSPG